MNKCTQLLLANLEYRQWCDQPAVYRYVYKTSGSDYIRCYRHRWEWWEEDCFYYRDTLEPGTTNVIRREGDVRQVQGVLL